MSMGLEKKNLLQQRNNLGFKSEILKVDFDLVESCLYTLFKNGALYILENFDYSAM
jgi:hypothetical protein